MEDKYSELTPEKIKGFIKDITNNQKSDPFMGPDGEDLDRLIKEGGTFGCVTAGPAWWREYAKALEKEIRNYGKGSII